MKSTLEAMGMAQWIKALYKHPTTKVKVNRTLSPPFEMYNGMRQGCPLSPLFFVLSLEPLLSTIRNNSDIGGIKIGGA